MKNGRGGPAPAFYPAPRRATKGGETATKTTKIATKNPLRKTKILSGSPDQAPYDLCRHTRTFSPRSAPLQLTADFERASDTSLEAYPMRMTPVLLACAACALMTDSVRTQQAPSRPPTRPIDPIAGIVDAFKTHSVVALGEGDHGNEQGHRFRLALIRDPRFTSTVTDVIVEFGNALYQPIIDRFVSGGDVDSTELRRVWQNTTQLNTVWDTPIYEEFFRSVREVNASLSPGRRLRVLLGDPPVDWARIRTFKDVFAQMREVGDRDAHPTAVIRREVIARGRRALVIYGDFHLDRTPPALRIGCEPGSTIPCFPGSIVDQLEGAAGVRVFNIRTVTGVDLRSLQADVARWPVPSLGILRGTALGSVAYREFWAAGPAVVGPDGNQTASPGSQRPMEEAYEAVLYLGPPSSITYARLPESLCADTDYVQMRKQRLAMGPGLAPFPCNR